MEDYISSDFDGAPVVVGVGNPDKVSFCVFGISKEKSGFTTRLKFCEVVGDNACGAF